MKIRRSWIFLIVIFIAFICFFLFQRTNNSSHWLVYTSKPIGTYSKQFSKTLYYFDDNSLLINDQSGNTYKINTLTGNIKWKFEVEDYSPFAVSQMDDNNVLINSFDANLFAVDFNTGLENWRFTNPNNTFPDTPVISDSNDRSIFFGDRKGTLYAIDKELGVINWEYQFEPINLDKVNHDINPVHFGRLFQDETNLYIRSNTESKIIAINKDSGKIEWENTLKYSHGDIFIKDRFLIANTNESTLSIDKLTGNKLWQTNFYIPANSKNIDEEFIYLISNSQQITKIELLTGKTLWNLNTSGKIKPEIMFIGDMGYLQIHTDGNTNKLVAFKKSSGEISWETNINSDITASSLTDETALLGTVDGEIISIDLNKGLVIDKKYLGGIISNIFQLNKDIVVGSISEADHATFTKLSQEFETIWSYKSPYKVSNESIYFHQNRVIYMDKGRQLVGSINAESNKSFTSNDFSFESQANTNEELSIEMKEFFKFILPGFLKQSDSQTFTKDSNLVERLIYHLQKLKEKQFSIDQNYNGSILEITLKHHMENLGVALDNDVNLSAIITSPSNKEFIVKGFNYQKNIWKIRFRPNEIGTWKYRLKVETPILIRNINLDGRIEIDQPSNISFIELKDNETYNLYLEDGQKFYPLGLEDVIRDYNFDKDPLNQWGIADTPKPPSKLEDVDFVDFKDYLEQYSNAGFNFFRWGVGNASFTLWQELSDYQKIDFLANKYGDKLAQELKKQDYHIMMTIFGFHPPFPFSIEDPKNQEVVRNYLDHVIPRYASYVDIWEITNEADVSDEWLSFVIEHIKKIDPYNHPISTNWDKPQMEELNLINYHWYDSQSLYQTTLLTKNLISNLKQFEKPIIFSEIGNVVVNWDQNSAIRMRVKIWTGFFNQAYFVIWNQPREIYYNANNANIYLGPEERTYTKIFAEFVNSLDQDLQSFQVDDNNEKLEIFGLKNNSKAYVYIVKNAENQNIMEVDLPFEPKKIKWISPESGLVINGNNFSGNKITLPFFNLDLIGEIEL